MTNSIARKYSLTIHGKKTSITTLPSIWRELGRIAKARHLTLATAAELAIAANPGKAASPALEAWVRSNTNALLPLFENRETWLEALIRALRPTFALRGYPLPEMVKVALGFPYLAKRAKGGKALGECWASEASGDGSTEIFISPLIADRDYVARVLVHELVHAAVGVKHAHKAPFARAGRALDLEGKPAHMIGGATQWQWLGPIVEALGPLPHSGLVDAERAGEKKQTTRMLKVTCPCCGFTFRTSAKWLEGKAHLNCPDPECGTQIDLA